MYGYGKGMGKSMKRIVCLILVVCLFPVCASALDLEVFNTFAGVFGEPELSGGVVDWKRTTFECDGCSVQFMDENGKTYNSNLNIPSGSEGSYNLTAVWWDFVYESVVYEYG